MDQRERHIAEVKDHHATVQGSLTISSDNGGSQRVTLSGGVAQASAQICRFCRVQVKSTNSEVVRIRIGSVCGADDGVELLGSPFLTPYSVSNLNSLYFYSTDVDAIVDIEYFS